MNWGYPKNWHLLKYFKFFDAPRSRKFLHTIEFWTDKEDYLGEEYWVRFTNLLLLLWVMRFKGFNFSIIFRWWNAWHITIHVGSLFLNINYFCQVFSMLTNGNFTLWKRTGFSFKSFEPFFNKTFKFYLRQIAAVWSDWQKYLTQKSTACVSAYFVVSNWTEKLIVWINSFVVCNCACEILNGRHSRRMGSLLGNADFF